MQQQHTGNHESSLLDDVAGTRAGAENVEEGALREFDSIEKNASTVRATVGNALDSTGIDKEQLELVFKDFAELLSKPIRQQPLITTGFAFLLGLFVGYRRR